MSTCVVIRCDREASAVVGKPTPWGAWKYWVCADHKADLAAGAAINDQSDGRSITLTSPTE